MPLTNVGLDAYASALVGLKGEGLLLLRYGWNDWAIGGAVPIPRIGLLGNPRGIQIGVTRRTGYLKGGAETPGCMRSWLLGGQGSTEPRCQWWLRTKKDQKGKPQKEWSVMKGNHRVVRGYVPFVVAVSLRPSFCLWPGTEEKEGKKEGRPKDRLESGVGLWLWPALPASGYRKPEKEEAQKVMLPKREPEGHHGVMDAVPLIRTLLPRGRIKNSREVQRPNVWKGIHLRGSSLRPFFVWPWAPPRNFMRHIGVRGASRHDRWVRCAFEAIYDRHLEKHPAYMDLGSCADLLVEALRPLGLPCKCVSDLIWLDRGGVYPSEL